MILTKSCFIKNIKDSQALEDLFLIKEMTRAETRAGKPYIKLVVMDSTGEISGNIWEEADRYNEEFKPGQVIRLNGQAQAYRGILQLKINRIQAVAESEVDRSLFLPTAPVAPDAMTEELLRLIMGIKDKRLKKLVLAFFTDLKFVELFKNAPAAKQMHHAYHGGLLEHTLAVANLANLVAGLYPVVDHSLLMAGAILHDLGKIKEYSFNSYPFDYTDDGRLMGHAVMAVEMIQEKIATIQQFPGQRATSLKHLILSHHGRHEFGAPVVPMMLEAFILHFVDDLDAKINTITKISEKAGVPGYQWTEYQRALERFLYVAGPDNQTEAAEPEIHTDGTTKARQSQDDVRQRLLFDSGKPFTE